MTGPLEARLEALNDQAALVSAVKGQLACLSSQLDVIGRQRFGRARLSPAAVHALVEISDGLAELLDLATQAAAELVELDVSLFRVGGDVPVSRDGEDRVGASPAVDRPVVGDAAAQPGGRRGAPDAAAAETLRRQLGDHRDFGSDLAQLLEDVERRIGVVAPVDPDPAAVRAAVRAAVTPLVIARDAWRSRAAEFANERGEHFAERFEDDRISREQRCGLSVAQMLGSAAGRLEARFPCAAGVCQVASRVVQKLADRVEHLLIHSLAPSSLAGTESVGASPAAAGHPAAGDVSPGGAA